MSETDVVPLTGQEIYVRPSLFFIFSGRYIGTVTCDDCGKRYKTKFKHYDLDGNGVSRECPSCGDFEQVLPIYPITKS